MVAIGFALTGSGRMDVDGTRSAGGSKTWFSWRIWGPLHVRYSIELRFCAVTRVVAVCVCTSTRVDVYILVHQMLDATVFPFPFHFHEKRNRQL